MSRAPQCAGEAWLSVHRRLAIAALLLSLSPMALAQGGPPATPVAH